MLWEALKQAFQFDQSAARPAGSMTARKLIVFEHGSELGEKPSHVLFDLVEIRRKNEDKPPRYFTDYEVKVGPAPQGVTLVEML